MRRLSVLLSTAAVVVAVIVVSTYLQNLSNERTHQPAPIASIQNDVKASATRWHWGKDDPQTNCPVVRVVADSFRAVHDPATFELTGMQLKLFNKGCSTYTYVQTSLADFDEMSGLMSSKGDVLIIMNVPARKEPTDRKATEKLVHVRTSGVKYETKTGKVDTAQRASFQFANGSGQSRGAEYDPNTHQLHMKSEIALDWIGGGPADRVMHIEAGELRWDESTGKVYLWPWSRLRRNNTVINGGNSEVTLVNGVLDRVETVQAVGASEQETRHVEFGADKLVALFNDNGDMTQITGEPKAHLVSQDASSKTVMTADRAVLHFDIQTEDVDGQERNSSILHEVVASGNAVLDSSPAAQRTGPLPDTHILRSQSIEMAMKPGGREINSLHTQAPGQLEFVPNQPERPHRWMDGERIEVKYGEENSIQSFHATQVKTRTQKPLTAANQHDKDGKPSGAPPLSFTWSDELNAQFTPKTNEIATLEQKGNFRYEEGLRHATSVTAVLEQAANRITLSRAAKVWDDTGTTAADTIVLNQQTGDMDATGQVASTHQPDQQKPTENSSLLDQSQPLQARADKMSTRDHNLKVHYEKRAVLWQGANRIQADVVDIDRDEQTLHATGNVVSQLVDKQDNNSKASQTTSSASPVRLEKVSTAATPSPDPVPKPKKVKPMTYTIVHAPELLYQDDERLAHYTGGVQLVRDKMTVKSNELRAFLTKEETDADKQKNQNNDDSGTSLDHAFADGAVTIVDTANGRTRTGTSQHCEYYPKENKVILNGGDAKMVDSRKGTTIGQQLTYYSEIDRVVVEGAPKHPIVSDLLKGK
jgi:lipopolysaccharide export system protein LptA